MKRLDYLITTDARDLKEQIKADYFYKVKNVQLFSGFALEEAQDSIGFLQGKVRYKHQSLDYQSFLTLYKEQAIDWSKLFGQFIFFTISKQTAEIVVINDWLSSYACYFHKAKEKINLSNSYKLLLQVEGNFELNTLKVQEYLGEHFIDYSKTLYENIFRLLPGSILNFHNNLELSQYLQKALVDPATELSFEEVSNKLSKLLPEIVDFYSDDKSAFQVSGGIDSSAVFVAGAIKQSSLGLNVSFQANAMNEEKYIQAIEEKTSLKITRVPELTVTDVLAKDFISMLDYFPDWPNGIQATQLYKYCERSSILNLLTGVGGDQVFSNLDKSERGNLFSLYVPSILKALIPKKRYFPQFYKFTEIQFLKRINSKQLKSRKLAEQKVFTRLQQNILNSNFLEYFDSMHLLARHCQVELYHPLLDLELVSLVQKVSTNQRGLETKALLRSACKDTLPEVISQRNDKAEFTGLYDSFLSSPEIGESFQNCQFKGLNLKLLTTLQDRRFVGVESLIWNFYCLIQLERKRKSSKF